MSGETGVEKKGSRPKFLFSHNADGQTLSCERCGGKVATAVVQRGRTPKMEFDDVRICSLCYYADYEMDTGDAVNIPTYEYRLKFVAPDSTVSSKVTVRAPAFKEAIDKGLNAMAEQVGLGGVSSLVLKSITRKKEVEE